MLPDHARYSEDGRRPIVDTSSHIRIVANPCTPEPKRTRDLTANIAEEIPERILALTPKLLSALQLRYPREMTISRNQKEVMFQSQRRNPKGIVRNRRAGASELNEDPRIVFCGFPAGQQHPNRGLRK